MKKSDQLKQQRAALEEKRKPLLEAADLNEEQTREFDSLQSQIEKMDADIAREEKREALIAASAGQSGRSISEKEEKEIGGFSFARALRSLCDNKQPDGLEGEMHQEGVREFTRLGKSVKGFAVPMLVLNNKRASTGQNITTAGDGKELIREDMPVFIESLKNALVLTQLGATFLTGLTGNLPLLKGGSFTAAWVAEGSNVSFTKEAFTKALMSPKSLMVAGAISKHLLVQTNNIADQLVRNELIKALSQGIQLAAINGSGVAPVPTGILNTTGIGSVVGGTNGAKPTWGNIVDLETQILQDNVVGEIAYLTNSKVSGYLKQTLKSSGVAGYILENGQMNGCKVAVTNTVPSNLTKGETTGVEVCSTIIAGVWSELFIGMWGGLDMIVDPYTRADYGEIKLVFDQFADIALRNPESFAAMKDALTA
jgi:HK97 family phage major capsid protein